MKRANSFAQANEQCFCRTLICFDAFIFISKFVFSNLDLESRYNQIRHKQSLKNKGSHIHINIITVVESTTRRDVTNKTKIIAYKLNHKRVSCAIKIAYAVQRKLIIVGKNDNPELLYVHVGHDN